MPAVVSGGSYSSTSTSPATISVTVGSSGLLGIGSALFRAANTLSSMTFDGSAMSAVDAQTGNPENINGRSIDVRRVSPSVGTYDFVVTLNVATQLVSGFVLIEDYDTTTPIGATAKTTQTGGTPISTSVTSAATDLILDFASASSAAALTEDGTQTGLFSVTNSELAGGSSTKAGSAGSTTMSWSCYTSLGSSIVILAIQDAPSGGTTHATSGDLVGPGSALDGTAAHIAIHATSGDLVGPGAVLDGTAAHIAKHATTGVLVGSGAVVEGTAARVAGTAEHATSGDLVGPGAVLDGTAAHIAVHDTSGALVGQASVLEAVAAHLVTHETSGILVGQGSTLTGSAVNGTFVPTTTSGVKKKPQARFLRRAPKLPWEVDDEPEPIRVAPPRRKRIPLPVAEKLQQIASPIPIQTVREISAPVISIPDVGIAQLEDDDEDWLWLI